jgi:SpoVK/Ycf46/Vps4 family AAA+-type ATPase
MSKNNSYSKPRRLADSETRSESSTWAELDRPRRRARSSRLSLLAQKLPLPYERSELVVPPVVVAALDWAVTWVCQRKTDREASGFLPALSGRGLTALFAGPPGTGKTMAAQVLARQLGLDLYRIDLSRALRKYIGETEKNLAEVFDGLKSCVLLFEEADALLGKLSEVKDAGDRYANMASAYLLQRIEMHDGVTILTANAKKYIDPVFLRRIQVIATFAMPSAEDRQRIWHGMFLQQAEREDDVDLASLAREFKLSGGEIKNAALTAASVAAAEGMPIAMRHLTAAVHRELAKAGRNASGASTL